MFVPPRCPRRRCVHHRSPQGRWYARHGSYQPLCRPHPVPRFRCQGCRRTFSRQTFRMDYRDHRPDLNARLVRLLASGVGLRQSARMLGISRRCLELKFRKLARHLRRLHLNLFAPLPEGSSLQFDELESFEAERTLRPLSVPLLIEKKSRLLLWAESARIPARHRRTRHGKRRAAGTPRPDRSRAHCLRTLRRAAPLVGALSPLLVETDQKKSYPSLLKQAFGSRPLAHSQTSSRRVRDVSNPLFAINHAEAMLRDLCGRLRRQSWLASKQRRYLDLGLCLYAAWRNLVRRRFNQDQLSPAAIAGWVPRRMSVEELCTWRQEWGKASIHPLSEGEESIEGYEQRRRKAAG